MSGSNRWRNVVFTLNNYTVEEQAMLVPNVDIKYIIYAEEVAPGTGTPHLQGYCEFYKQLRQVKVKELLGRRAHIERRKGTQRQAIDYCKKINQDPPVEPNTKVFEAGVKNKAGERTDLTTIKEMVQECNLVEVLPLCQNYQQIRYAEKLYEYKSLSTEYKKKQVFWFYGETGTGKTREAYKIIGDNDFWRSTTNGGQWFNGYYGQKYALIDELRAANWPYKLMLELLDGYEIRCPNKGGFTIWNPDTVIITCPRKPEDAYQGQLQYGDGHIDQLLRRITEVREMTLHLPEHEPNPEEIDISDSMAVEEDVLQALGHGEYMNMRTHEIINFNENSQ